MAGISNIPLFELLRKMANKIIPEFPLFDLFLSKMNYPLYGLYTVKVSKFKGLNVSFSLLATKAAVDNRFILTIVNLCFCRSLDDI